MDFVHSIAIAFNESPFKVLETDAELVIMWINYFLEKGSDEPTKQTKTKTKNQPQRIRVNDKTATNGWF